MALKFDGSIRESLNHNHKNEIKLAVAKCVNKDSYRTEETLSEQPCLLTLTTCARGGWNWKAILVSSPPPLCPCKLLFNKKVST